LTSYYVNKVLFKIKKDMDYRRLFQTDFEAAVSGMNLTPVEKDALLRRDFGRLGELGAKPMLLLPFAGITRSERSFAAG